MFFFKNVEVHRSKKRLPLFSSYPLSAEKLTVAKSIITTFPSLSVRVAGQGEGFVSKFSILIM